MKLRENYNISVRLRKLARGNVKYAEFNRQNANTKKVVLGVRMPELRWVAKDLALSWDYTAVSNFTYLDRTVFEEVLLLGLIITYTKLTDTQRINLTKKYLQLADSWSEIDVLAQKRVFENKQIWWDFILECLESQREFVVRYGVVELMANFLDEQNIDTVFARVRRVKHQGYYVKMAMAWLYATAAIDFFDLVITEIRDGEIGVWTKRKALQKMIESRQISEQQKVIIKTLREQLR